MYPNLSASGYCYMIGNVANALLDSRRVFLGLCRPSGWFGVTRTRLDLFSFSGLALTLPDSPWRCSSDFPTEKVELREENDEKRVKR